jgi:hypothetical protein
VKEPNNEAIPSKVFIYQLKSHTKIGIKNGREICYTHKSTYPQTTFCKKNTKIFFFFGNDIKHFTIFDNNFVFRNILLSLFKGITKLNHLLDFIENIYLFNR